MVNAVKEQTSLEEIITASFSNYLPQKPIFAFTNGLGRLVDTLIFDVIGEEMFTMPRTHPPYPPEFKLEAVRLVKEGNRNIADVARDLDVSGQSLRNWIRQHEIDEGQREGLTTSEREELRRLHREIRMLREEREILKKAAAFFAQETNRTR